MLATLREISIPCFFTSYLIVLALELLRLLGRVPGRGAGVLVMMGLGLFTHGTYLVLRVTAMPVGRDSGYLATWMDWSLLLAFGLAVVFLIMYLRRPDTIVSFFFVPAVLLLIGLSVSLRNQPPFTRGEAVEVWRTIHALGMAIGSSSVLIGFLAGVMYLTQSWRLKHKRAGSALRLPTLETLQGLSRVCLLSSTVAVGIGVAAGVVMNLNRWGYVAWNEEGVLLSGVLFVWLLVASIIEMTYAAARRGRKMAYLTMASFAFLVLAMYGVLASSHGADAAAADARPDAVDASLLNEPSLNHGPVIDPGVIDLPVIDSGVIELPVIDPGVIELPVIDPGVIELPVIDPGVIEAVTP